MDKKAISPLLSTIILLVFAIGLGGLVISWGKTNFPDEKVDCLKASLSIVTISGKPAICLKDSYVQLTAQNDGGVFLQGIKAAFATDKEPIASSAKLDIPIGELVKVAIPLGGNFGKIQKGLFTPTFSYQGKEYICAKKGFTVESISEC
ncbi:hypothetical protein HYU14_01635 [Candidatus Woesearchaeota archaeon]|nr:hypothetical protein [Candidatus Woesearchaeota archaeon]